MTRDDVRRLALDVAHLWPMPPPVRAYLETGDGRADAIRALHSYDDTRWSQYRRAAAWVAYEAAAADMDVDAAIAAERDARAGARMRKPDAVWSGT